MNNFTAKYEIPLVNLEGLETVIEKLNKRAKKLKCDPISFVKSDPFLKEASVEGKKKKIAFVSVTISGQEPKLNGWSFDGIIEPTEEGNLVRLLPGSTLTEEDIKPYYYGPQKCDQCKEKRNRKATYLVKHESGEVAQVGSTCLKDFTGHDSPHQAAKIAEWLAEIDEACRESRHTNGGFGDGAGYWDLEEYLAWTSASIKRYGWISRKEAYSTPSYHQKMATADIALRAMLEQGTEKDWGFAPTEKDLKVAQKTIEWASSLEEENNYLHSVHVVCKSEMITHKWIGLAASAVNRYHIEAKKKFFASLPESKHVGKIGETVTLSLLCYEARECKMIDKEKGEVTFYAFEFVDQKSGCRYTILNNASVFEQGKRYTIRAKVKGHDEYQGVKKTKLGYWSFVNNMALAK